MKEPDEKSREGVEIAGIFIILGIVIIIASFLING